MVEVENPFQPDDKSEPMLIRFQSLSFGFWNRLRFLWSGKLWLKIEYNWDGNPTHVAAGFQPPEEAVLMTPEELQKMQQQIQLVLSPQK